MDNPFEVFRLQLVAISGDLHHLSERINFLESYKTRDNELAWKISAIDAQQATLIEFQNKIKRVFENLEFMTQCHSENFGIMFARLNAIEDKITKQHIALSKELIPKIKLADNPSINAFVIDDLNLWTIESIASFLNQPISVVKKHIKANKLEKKVDAEGVKYNIHKFLTNYYID